MKRKAILFIVLLSSFTALANTKVITCVIEGTVENRNSKALYLMKATADARTGIRVRIPIVNNTFEYKLLADEQEAYQLIFDEEWDEMAYKSIIFFPDTSEVRLLLYSSAEAEDRNKVFGGVLNRSYRNHLMDFASVFKTNYLTIRQKRREAMANKAYYSLAFDSLTLLLKNADKVKASEYSAVLSKMQKDGSDLTALGKSIKLSERQVIENMYTIRYQYVQKHNTPVSYYMVYDDMHNHHEDPQIRSLSFAAYDQLAKAMPNHPYTLKLGHFVNGLKLKVGEPLIDFMAPDLDGKNYKLSSLLKGKLTLLDLWASWCGPCITKTREVMPLYDEFKDKGFQVIGVAREFKDLENLKIALKRERYPWITLVELEDKQLIWNKYGLNHSGGGMVLFDEKGKILALDPTTDELKKIMKQIL